MTLIYVPRLIESAEQAETLPEGTIMFLSAGPYVWTARDPGGEFLDHYGRPWHFENTQDDEPFTALVPVEAEEKYGAEMKWDAGATHDTHVSLGLSLDNARWQAENNPDYATGRIMRQYRTPWEEA